MRWLLWIAPLAVLGALIGVRVSARPQQSSAQTPPPPAGVPVTTASVTRGAITQTLGVTGVLRAEQQVNVGTKLPGRVLAVLVREGDQVTAGQTLLLLDDRDYTGQIRQAEAGLRAARANASKARQGKPLKAAEVELQIAQAEENVRAAEALLRQSELGAKLEAKQADADLEKAQSGVRSAEAGVAKARKGARPDEITRAEAGLRQAELGLEKMQRDFASAKKLYDNGGLTRRDFEDAQTGLRIAQEQVNDARAAVRLAKAGATTEELALAEEELERAKSALVLARDTTADRKRVAHERTEAARTQVKLAQQQLTLARASNAQVALTEEDVQAAQAMVEQAQAGLTLARQQAAETRITAPVGGVVTDLNARLGEMLLPGSVLLKITNASSLLLEVSLPLRELTSLRVGQPARITVDGMPGPALAGTVAEIIRVASDDNRSFKARLAVPSQRGLTPGAFARGVVELAHHPNTLLVPRAALRGLDEARAERTAQVLLVQEGRVRASMVKLGVLDEQRAQVLQGLADGEAVVTLGADSLRDGDRVRVIK